MKAVRASKAFPKVTQYCRLREKSALNDPLTLQVHEQSNNNHDD